MILETDKAWAAGFFDGEGSVVLTKLTSDGRIRFGLCIRVTQRHKKPLLKLQELWGGSINKQKSEKYEKTNCWYWAVYGWDALYFLDDIVPYVVEKEKQVKLAIAFQIRRQVRPGKPRTLAERRYDVRAYDLLRGLNHA